MKRVERIRLYPTPHQQSALRFMLDVTRQLYNALLQQRRDAYRLRGRALASRDFAHKAARAIVTTADAIGLEHLSVRAMTRSAKGTPERPGVNVRAKSGLNRVLLDAGFGLLERLVSEKAEEAARVVVRVEARFSSQTCSRCGYVCARNRWRRRGRQCGAGDPSASAVSALKIAGCR
jgi:putative transposase